MSFKSCPARHVEQFVIYCIGTLKRFRSASVGTHENPSSGGFSVLTLCYCSLFMKPPMQRGARETVGGACAWLLHFKGNQQLTLAVISDTPASAPIIYETRGRETRLQSSTNVILTPNFK